MSDRVKMLVLDDYEGKIRASPGGAALRELADLTVADQPVAAIRDEDLAHVKVVMAVRERTHFDAAMFDRLPSLELLIQTGGHAYHVDAAAAAERGIVVSLGRRARGPQAAVPELVFALALAALRHFPQAHRSMHSGQWVPLVGRTLQGRRLGILGMGRHGKAVARLALAFGMDVVAWNRTGDDTLVDIDGNSVIRLPLDELLRTSDVLTVQLRLSDDSRGLLSHERLNAMKPGSVLVNTARGAIVDESALVEVLRDGPLAAAGLDVFAVEPLPRESLLRSLPNVVLTPHVGWTVDEVFAEFALIASEQLADYIGRRLDRDELLDKQVAVPDHGRAGGLRPT
jgi:phosphoglycerate dehydrogenase-like enzyme